MAASYRGQLSRNQYQTLRRGGGGAPPPRPPCCSAGGRLLLLVLLLAAAPLRGAAQSATFSDGRVIATDVVDLFAVFAADVDGDGDVDVVTAARMGGRVVWYANRKDEGGEADELFPSSDVGVEISVPASGRDGPRSISVGDINGDGYLDVVVAFEFTSTVTWYTNIDGLGRFELPVDIATDTLDATWVTVADIDGDGDLDVVSASLGDDRVAWFENEDGAGTFSAGANISTTALGANMVIAADIDNDGDQDVVAASYDGNRVTWYENTDGEGTFSAGVDVTTVADNPTYVAAGDLNGDGDIDLASASFSDGAFYWHENTDGAGTYAPGGTEVDSMDSAQSVVMADIDQDGDLDLVACDHGGGRIVWYENLDGNGALSVAIDIATDVGVWEVIAVDLDGDGDMDLLSINRDDGRVQWYENFLIDSSAAPAVDSSAAPAVAPIATSPGAPGTTTPASPDTAPPVGPGGNDDEGNDDGLSVEAIVGIVTAVLVFFGGGAAAYHFKCVDIHVCNRITHHNPPAGTS